MPKPLVTDIDRHIGSRLKKLRQREEVSAAALAEAIDSTQQQISRYEHGQNKLGAAQLFRIAQHLGVPMSWFFQGLDGDDAGSVERPLSPHHEQASIQEDLCVLEAMWPRLAGAQRAAVLALLDTLLCE